MFLEIKKLFKLFIFVIKRKNSISLSFGPVAVVYSLADYQQRDLLESFSSDKFSVKFPVESFRNKKFFIIESKFNSTILSKDKIVILTSSPILYLLMISVRKKNLVFRIIFFLFFSLNIKIRNSFRKNLILRILNEVEDLDIYTTISVLQSYPFEFYFSKKIRSFKTNVIHYSENPGNIGYEGLANQSYESRIVTPTSKGDIHWVWTKEYADFLKKINQVIEFKPVGSITFKIAEIVKKIVKYERILIFDVPVSAKNNSNSSVLELAHKFIADIVEVVKEDKKLRNFELFLKPKRKLILEHHSQKYIEMIEKFKDITIVDWASNPYTLMGEARLSISIPFTSTAHIGPEVGTNSIFYYPYDKQFSLNIYESRIPVIYGKEALRRYLQKYL